MTAAHGYAQPVATPSPTPFEPIRSVLDQTESILSNSQNVIDEIEAILNGGPGVNRGAEAAKDRLSSGMTESALQLRNRASSVLDRLTKIRTVIGG